MSQKRLSGSSQRSRKKGFPRGFKGVPGCGYRDFQKPFEGVSRDFVDVSIVLRGFQRHFKTFKRAPEGFRNVLRAVHRNLRGVR